MATAQETPAQEALRAQQQAASPAARAVPLVTPAPNAPMAPLSAPPQIPLGDSPAGPRASTPGTTDDSRKTVSASSVPYIGSPDDEVLLLLQQADPTFKENVIKLPEITVEQDGDIVPFLGLQRALELALRNSYSYAATAAQADQAEYAMKAAAGQMGPTLDVRAQRGREFSSPSSAIDGTTGRVGPSSTHTRWDVSVVGRQPVFAPGSFFEFQKQRSLSNAADLRRDDARETLYYNAIKAYYDVLRAYSSVSFARSYAERMNTLLDYMRKRMEGGGASRIDFERVRGRALTAQSAAAEAEGALESTMVTLNQITGRRIQSIEVPDHMMPIVPVTSKVALQNITEDNPGVRAALHDVEAARQELRSARSRFSPTFAIEATQQKTRGAGGAVDTDTGTLQLTTDRRLMLVMTMNLLNGGTDMYYQKQIGAKFVEKNNTALDLERRLREQIEINYRTLGAVRKRMDISRQAYQTNANVADVFLEQLSTGSKQLLDVLDAYQQAFQARMDFATLLFQQADISYQILRNTGKATVTPAAGQANVPSVPEPVVVPAPK